MATACVRRSYLEKLHCGITPVTHTGDYSDVRAINAEGRVIPWKQVSRVNQDEMKALMVGVVNRVYTFLARTLPSRSDDAEFSQALARAATSWTEARNEPRFLPDFLMLTSNLSSQVDDRIIPRWDAVSLGEPPTKRDRIPPPGKRSDSDRTRASLHSAFRFADYAEASLRSRASPAGDRPHVDLSSISFHIWVTKDEVFHTSLSTHSKRPAPEPIHQTKFTLTM